MAGLEMGFPDHIGLGYKFLMVEAEGLTMMGRTTKTYMLGILLFDRYG
jgi:hypothetical protein